jgi:hypothetical protein
VCVCICMIHVFSRLAGPIHLRSFFKLLQIIRGVFMLKDFSKTFQTFRGWAKKVSKSSTFFKTFCLLFAQNIKKWFSANSEKKKKFSPYKCHLQDSAKIFTFLKHARNLNMLWWNSFYNAHFNISCISQRDSSLLEGACVHATPSRVTNALLVWCRGR